MDINKAVKDALQELVQKDLDQIQVETAVKWCGRSIAAQMMGRDEKEITEYAHEAVEHAALSGDDETLFVVRAALRSRGIVV